MENLKELIKILNRKKLSSVDVLDKTFLSKEESNVYLKLYNAIENGTVNTDIEAEYFIYGAENNVAYRQLKSRFKKKFLKTLLLLDADEYFGNNKIAKNYYECISTAYSIEILIKLNGTTKTAIDLIKQEYARILSFKYYDILIKYSNYLILYYTLNGDVKKADEEAERFQVYITTFTAENECIVLFNKIQAKFIAGKPVNQSLIDELKLTIETITNKISHLQDSGITFNLYQLKLNYEECTGNVQSLLTVTDELQLFFEQYPQLLNNTRKTLILLYKLKSLLHLKDYAGGLQLIDKEKNYFPTAYSFNWYAIKEFEFKLYLHSHQTIGAGKVLQEVMSNKFFNKQNENLREKWKIFEAYFILLDNYLHNGNYKFSIGKFINEVPVASKDKTGFNYAIRLVEILFLMAKKDYNPIFKKMDGLSLYKTRYLNDNTYKRNHLFLSLLLKAEKTGFNAREMRKLHVYEIEELSKPNTYIIAEWEVIPFENIWEMMLELAKN